MKNIILDFEKKVKGYGILGNIDGLLSIANKFDSVCVLLINKPSDCPETIMKLNTTMKILNERFGDEGLHFVGKETYSENNDQTYYIYMNLKDGSPETDFCVSIFSLLRELDDNIHACAKKYIEDNLAFFTKHHRYELGKNNICDLNLKSKNYILKNVVNEIDEWLGGESILTCIDNRIYIDIKLQ